MAFAGSLGTQREVAVINITPLVDVLLVLLIIFMVAAPLLSRTLALDLAPARIDEDPAPPLALAIAADGSLVLDGAPLPTWLLDNALRAAHADAPNRPLQVSPAADASYQQVAVVMAAARNAGIAGIGIATD